MLPAVPLVPGPLHRADLHVGSRRRTAEEYQDILLCTVCRKLVDIYRWSSLVPSTRYTQRHPDMGH